MVWYDILGIKTTPGTHLHAVLTLKIEIVCRFRVIFPPNDPFWDFKVSFLTENGLILAKNSPKMVIF